MEFIVVCSKWAANQKLLYKIINDHLGRTLSICIDHPFFCSCVLQRNMIHLKLGFLVAIRLFSSRSRMRSKCAIRGGEWYLEKRGSRKILAGSQNLGSIFDKSRSLVFSWFAFTFLESRNFSPKSLGLRFLTRNSASWWVSDFTIRHPC